MRHLSTLLFALPFSVFAQTIHPVSVGGSTLNPNNLPYYAPSTLTIPVGDIVLWSNVSGTHNVDGDATFFPDNPAPFSYQPAQFDFDWSFQFTFTIPGTYHYQCDTEGHSATQTGTIIVESENSIAESGTEHAMTLFPTPATDQVMVDAGHRRIARVEITSVDGRSVVTPAFTPGSLVSIPIADLIPGNYLLRVAEVDGTLSTLRFTKK
jgi:plastocyanin